VLKFSGKCGHYRTGGNPMIWLSLLLTGVVTGCCQQLNAPRKYPISCLSGDGCFCITVHICIHLHDFITTTICPRGMPSTATTCPKTSLGIPKYAGHVPGLQCPGMSHVRGSMDPGTLSIPGFLGQSRDVPCQGSLWIRD